jgi:hypothetical protein
MSIHTKVEGRKKKMVRPFVLTWAETAPESLFWSDRTVFSPTLNGLEIHMVLEADKCESTGTAETADSTHTNL